MCGCKQPSVSTDKITIQHVLIKTPSVFNLALCISINKQLVKWWVIHVNRLIIHTEWEGARVGVLDKMDQTCWIRYSEHCRHVAVWKNPSRGLKFKDFI